MRRPTKYVPLSVHFATGRTGTAILEKYGLEGLGVWAAMIAAAKAANPEGQIIFMHDQDWGAIGLGHHPPLFTLKAFLRFLGQRKQTRQTAHGRVTYVTLTRWKQWNDTKNSYLSSQRSARYRQQTKRDDKRDDSVTHPVIQKQKQKEEKELEAERSETTPNSNGLPISHELKITSLLTWIGRHADEETPTIIRALANKLPEASLAKVCESARTKRPTNRAGYIVNALKSELDKGLA